MFQQSLKCNQNLAKNAIVVYGEDDQAIPRCQCEKVTIPCIIAFSQFGTKLRGGPSWVAACSKKKFSAEIAL